MQYEQDTLRAVDVIPLVAMVLAWVVPFVFARRIRLKEKLRLGAYLFLVTGLSTISLGYRGLPLWEIVQGTLGFAVVVAVPLYLPRLLKGHAADAPAYGVLPPSGSVDGWGEEQEEDFRSPHGRRPES